MTNARQSKSARDKAAALRAEAERQATRRTAMIISASAVAVLVLVVGVAVAIGTMDRPTSAAPRNTTNNAAMYGNVNAPVTIDTYEDFMCPICGQFETANKEQIDAWVKAGTVKVQYHPVSILDPASNGTKYSTRAANAAAGVLDLKPEAYTQFHHALYSNQPQEDTEGLTDDKIIDLAVQVGVDKNAITEVINDKKFFTWVENRTGDFQNLTKTLRDTNGNAPKGAGTPTVVVNGVWMNGNPRDPNTLKTLVDQITAKLGATPTPSGSNSPSNSNSPSGSNSSPAAS